MPWNPKFCFANWNYSITRDLLFVFKDFSNWSRPFQSGVQVLGFNTRGLTLCASAARVQAFEELKAVIGQQFRSIGGMGHGIAVTPKVAKGVLCLCLAMPVAALGVRLFVDPAHDALTHHEVQLPMPPHVPPPVPDINEHQQSADSR